MPLLRTTCAALAAVCLFASAHAAAATHDGRVLLPTELKRAERVIEKLRLIETAGDDARAFAAVYGKTYPQLFEEAAALREGDLKTDLSTAVFLYEAAQRALRAGDQRIDDCDAEIRELYRRLCREQQGATRARLLRAKARLHTRWAESMVAHARGQRDAKTLATLVEIRAERVIDTGLAARAVAELHALARDVRAYDSLSQFEEEGSGVARVSLKEFSSHAARALRAIDLVLASLPRGAIRQHILSARNSYRDGLFWWQKTDPRTSLTVSADALVETDALDSARIDPSAAQYIVVVNWRNAARHTARAEELIPTRARDTLAQHTQF